MPPARTVFARGWATVPRPSRGDLRVEVGSLHAAYRRAHDCARTREYVTRADQPYDAVDLRRFTMCTPDHHVVVVQPVDENLDLASDERDPRRGGDRLL